MSKKLVFRIAEASPHTLPMTRLAEYLTELATMLGSRDRVHFLGVEEGSAVNVMEVESGEEATVVSRVRDVRVGAGTKEAQDAYAAIREYLREDEFSAELETEEGSVILDFPLDIEDAAQVYGPFWQDGSLDGILMKIGGMDDTIPVHLLYEGKHYNCNANIDMARRLGHHLLQKPIRVHGKGKWYRDTSGKWDLHWFDILDFEELENSSLPDVVAQLRAIPSNDLMSLKDPLEEMQKIRHGE
ncbi:MAG TPA: hypothetical protein VIH97_13130 [Candidatus Acidoferrales bacterium]